MHVQQRCDVRLTHILGILLVVLFSVHPAPAQSQERTTGLSHMGPLQRADIFMGRSGAMCEPEGEGTDCNSNDFHDLCDLEFGISMDCDGNGIPDECEHLVLTEYEASDVAESHLFGATASIDGDYAVVGDPGYVNATGAAYVFERDGLGLWTEVAQFINPASREHDFFGSSVSMSGETFLVGSVGDNDDGFNSGAAYVFSRHKNGLWELDARLVVDDINPGDLVGYSVSLDGDTAVVSAHADDANGENAGAAHVFRRQSDNTWVQEGTLLAGDGGMDDYFGYSVAIENDTVVVGAVGKSDSGAAAGAAYVFRRSKDESWNQVARLQPADAAAGNFFGSAVSISDGIAMVTALGVDGTGVSSGAAYVFSETQRGGWQQMAKLMPDDASHGDVFGKSVTLDGPYALVGAIGDDYQDYDSGSVYIFEHFGEGAWNQIGKVSGASEGLQDYFGHSVSLDGLDMLIGAPENDTVEPGDAGNVYFGVLNIVPPCECDASQTIAEVKLVSSDAQVGDFFGSDVALDGDLAVVGAAFDDTILGANGGSATIFERVEGNWIPAATLLPFDGQPEDYFGNAVSISGERVAISAIGDDDFGYLSGSVYVYERNSNDDWIPVAKLYASDAAIVDAFGSDVSLSGDVLVVGAFGVDDRGPDSGAAYVFHRATNGQWFEASRLTAQDGLPYDFFGRSVAASGDSILVGAMWSDPNVQADSGAVYVYQKGMDDQWNFTDKLVPSDSTAADYFGQSVSIHNRMALVGAPGDDDLGDESGSAYLFWLDEMSTWQQIAKLLPADGMPNDHFGGAVSLYDRMAVIGADGHFSRGANSGAAYVFMPNLDAHWQQFAKFASTDVTDGDVFGANVSAGDGRIIVSAQGDDDSGIYLAGAAYIYDAFAIPWDCNLNRLLDVCDIETGYSVDENENGIPDECDDWPTDGHIPPRTQDCNNNAVPDEFEVLPCIDCDINEDERVNRDDQRRMSLCVEEFVPQLCAKADLDGDGEVTGRDRTLLQGCFTDALVNPPPGR